MVARSVRKVSALTFASFAVVPKIRLPSLSRMPPPAWNMKDM
jgi:hypothetical protein